MFMLVIVAQWIPSFVLDPCSMKGALFAFSVLPGSSALAHDGQPLPPRTISGVRGAWSPL